jgi:hypothetical protein
MMTAGMERAALAALWSEVDRLPTYAALAAVVVVVVVDVDVDVVESDAAVVQDNIAAAAVVDSIHVELLLTMIHASAQMIVFSSAFHYFG